MAERNFQSDRAAAAQVIGFLVGGFIFLAAFATVLVVTKDDEVDEGQLSETEVRSMAVALAELVLTSPGEGWHSGQGCDTLLGIEDVLTFSPDSVSRFGLGSEGCEPLSARQKNSLSFDKLTNLEKAAFFETSANGYVDYMEARSSLGLEDVGRDFHIRSSPVLASIRTLLDGGYLDPNLRPLYIGDYEPLDNDDVDYDVPHSSGMTDNGSKADLWVNISNDGVEASVFEVAFTLHLEKNDVELIRHTAAVAPGGYSNVTVWVPKTSDWSWASSAIDYVINDPVQQVGAGVIDGSTVDMVGSDLERLTDIHSGDLQFEWLGSPLNPKLYYYNAYNGKGQEVAYGDWKLEVFNGTGALVATDTNLHQRGWEALVLNGPDTYKVVLKTEAGSTLQAEFLLVTETLLGGYSPSGSSSAYRPNDSVAREIAYIAALIEHFDTNVFSAVYDHPDVPYAAGGDVFPDVKSVMNNDLVDVLIDDQGTPVPVDDVATLANYNVLIVGSNVDHQMMTSASAKESVRDWVYAGGMLMVFGSADQSVQWLQPIFHSSITSASGGLYTPDEDHPLLHVPNDLDHKTFYNNESAWAYTKAADEEHFTHVLKQGSDDLLALSDAGEFGDGRVLLSAFQPYDLVNGSEGEGCDLSEIEASCIGLQLVHNFVTQAYAGLFLDYGPPIPTDRTTGSATRLATVFHPQLDEVVVLQMQVYVF